MKAQEIFDKAVGALLKQGKKSAIEGIGCAYRSSVGCCAIGHLIPDDVYTIRMETKNVKGVLEVFPNLKNFLLPEDLTEEKGMELLTLLQGIHDSNHRSYWVQEFELAAEKFNLQWNFEEYELS